MALPGFQSSAAESLKTLARGEYKSSEERDQHLQVLLQAEKLKARDVVWMVFRPDRALRDTGTKILSTLRAPETVDLIVGECRGKADAVIRAASDSLFKLNVPGIAQKLAGFLGSPNEDVREVARRLVTNAPPLKSVEPLLWKLAESASLTDQLKLYERLAALEPSQGAMKRWNRLARDVDSQIKSIALRVLADRAPSAAVDLIVEQLPRADYNTQQHLIGSLSKLAQGEKPEFAERILPLMAAGDAATRSAVLKILLSMPDRHELVKRYLIFSKTLAGWARDRALESMREFGDDLIEPAIELLNDPDDEVRALALSVAGSFDDPRIIPATIGLLKDDDWWLRVTAAETLGRFTDPRCVEALVACLNDTEARWAAVEALGRIGDMKALPALAALLKDPAPEVRIEVLLAMRHFKHPKILQALRQVAATDENRFVRTRALEIAEAIAERDQSEIQDADKLRAEALKVQVGAGEPRLHTFLVATRNQGASDFHLAVSQPPMVRLAADLIRVKGEPFTAQQTEELLKEILDEEQWARVEKERQLDFCYYIPNAGRYRANVFLDQRGYNAVFRVIPEKPPTITDVGLPGHLAEIADYHQGLVLICGPSGSGKSTTLAALVNLFNETKHHHVLTMEEPVEFVHPFKGCLINQREIETDTESYSRALRGALRQDPDVIVIGDLRDNETVSLALTAAETGHIVLGTLNSTTAVKAVDRLIGSFPVVEQGQIRASLSDSLKFVVAQKLLPVSGERRLVPCFEILKGTASVANLIREEKTIQIRSLMQIGRSIGMQTVDDALKDLVARGLITAESAYIYADSKEEFEAMVSPEFLESRTYA
ncbi:MAG: PilT/PilU family type 4a pilus ATPase [bacterium]|nr:PilT/PilU family type 4a pilus ATPase [bacterium]